MSFNKRFVPELVSLEKELFEISSDEFYRRYVVMPDALVGSAESLEFIHQFAKEYEN